MVFYKPYIDLKEISALFPEMEFSEKDIYGAYVAYEGEIPQGKCLVRIAGYRCEVHVSPDNQPDALLTEGLLRAALNFAGNRNAYIAECRDVHIREVLLLLGFTEKDGVFLGDIPTLLLGSCCKPKNLPNG